MSVNKVNSDGSLSRVAGGTLYADSPIGTISPFGGSTIPSGYLLCNGAEVLKTTYAELYAVIGDAFGTASDNTKFVLPDLREATTKGVGLNAKGAYHYDNDGIALGEFVDDRIKSHSHNVYVRDTGHSHGTDSGAGLPNPNNLGITKNENGVGWSAYPTPGTANNTQSVSANIQVSSASNFSSIDNKTSLSGNNTNEVKAVGVNYIIKAKQVAVPADFSKSLVGYVGEETAYNLYQWSDTRAASTDPATYLDFVVEQDGWYSIDFALAQSDGDTNGFAIRDFDEQGGTHAIGRGEITGCTYYRSNIIVPLKAGTYRYHHSGKGTLNVYMNHRDFA